MKQEDYAADVLYWEALLGDVTEQSGITDWEPWANTAYENYVLGDEDIVIYSIWSASLGRALTIQQKLDDAPPSLCFLTRNAKQGFGGPVKHLVLMCSRNEDFKPYIIESLKLWFLSGVESFSSEIER